MNRITFVREATPIVYIGLGSNVGDRKQNILRSVEMLFNAKKIQVLELSTIHETFPLGIREQRKFLNAVVKVETSLNPIDLREVLVQIEDRLARVRFQRWGPRTIDLDILYYGNITMNTPSLRIPHPEIENRPFVQDALRELGCFIDSGFRRNDGRETRG